MFKQILLIFSKQKHRRTLHARSKPAPNKHNKELFSIICCITNQWLARLTSVSRPQTGWRDTEMHRRRGETYVALSSLCRSFSKEETCRGGDGAWVFKLERGRGDVTDWRQMIIKSSQETLPLVVGDGDKMERQAKELSEERWRIGWERQDRDYQISGW